MIQPVSRAQLLESSQCCVPPALIQISTSQLVGGQLQRILSTFHPFSHHFDYLHFFGYLYYQSFGIDACFRFKHWQISSYEKDPKLGPGFAYLVTWEPYQEYVLGHANKNEVSNFWFVFLVCVSHNPSQISTCSGLSAIGHANSKFSKGYSTTGIVCTTCSHEFVLPEGAGQLQKGERFMPDLFF